MKLGRLVFVTVTTVLTVVAAISAVVYFKDEIMEILAEVRKRLEHKRTSIFHNEYTDYADI